jgi:hypothetical protein
MSRFRLGSIVAVAAGILITTGGCTASPTATGAGDASLARMSPPPTTPPVAQPAPEEEEMTTLSSGYIGTGTRQEGTDAP